MCHKSCPVVPAARRLSPQHERVVWRALLLHERRARPTASSPPGASPPRQVPAANTALPLFVGHGSVDNLIPPVIATTTQEVLEGLGCSNVEFHM